MRWNKNGYLWVFGGIIILFFVALGIFQIRAFGCAYTLVCVFNNCRQISFLENPTMSPNPVMEGSLVYGNYEKNKLSPDQFMLFLPIDQITENGKSGWLHTLSVLFLPLLLLYWFGQLRLSFESSFLCCGYQLQYWLELSLFATLSMEICDCNPKPVSLDSLAESW